MACAGYSAALANTQIETLPLIWLCLLRDATFITDTQLRNELARRGMMAHYR